MNKPDIPPELAQLCDPWLLHLWGLRGTYAGTQIDWPFPEELGRMFSSDTAKEISPFHEQPCSTSLETGGKVKHGSNQLQPSKDP